MFGAYAMMKKLLLLAFHSGPHVKRYAAQYRHRTRRDGRSSSSLWPIGLVFWVRQDVVGASLGGRGANGTPSVYPQTYFSVAYMDGAVLIGQGQTISQPFIVALMTHLAAIDSDHTVLEVGTGSGYQAAVLARLVKGLYR